MKAKIFSPRKDNIQVISPVTVQQVLPISKVPTHTARLNNIRTGRIVQMSIKAATMLSTKYPDEFKIL